MLNQSAMDMALRLKRLPDTTGPYKSEVKKVVPSLLDFLPGPYDKNLPDTTIPSAGHPGLNLPPPKDMRFSSPFETGELGTLVNQESDRSYAKKEASRKMVNQMLKNPGSSPPTTVLHEAFEGDFQNRSNNLLNALALQLGQMQ